MRYYLGNGKLKTRVEIVLVQVRQCSICTVIITCASNNWVMINVYFKHVSTNNKIMWYSECHYYVFGSRVISTMAAYDAAHYADMVYFYGLCDGNATQAAARYRAKYNAPGDRHPDDKTIKAAWQRLQQTGTVLRRKKTGQTRSATDEEHETAVLQHFVEDPRTSTRRVAAAEDISQSLVVKILHRHRFHPYKVSLLQELWPNDPMNRLEFTLWLQARELVDRGFIQRVLWSDEAHFYRSGTVNRHNCHYWSDSNPHWMRTSHFQVP